MKFVLFFPSKNYSLTLSLSLSLYIYIGVGAQLSDGMVTYDSCESNPNNPNHPKCLCDVSSI